MPWEGCRTTSRRGRCSPRIEAMYTVTEHELRQFLHDLWHGTDARDPTGCSAQTSADGGNGVNSTGASV